MQGPKWPLFYSHVDPVRLLLIVVKGFVPWVELPVQRRLGRFSLVVSGYPTSTNIPRVNGLLMRHLGFGPLQLGIRAKVNDYLGSSMGVSISMVLILPSQLGIRA